jgi:DNA-binding NtrC family response regulator
MMDSIIMPRGEKIPAANGGGQWQSEISTSRKLRVMEVLARALLRRIESLRDTMDGGVAVSIADEVQHFEAELIKSALIETGGRQRRAARLLGMNITTLNRKLRRYNINTGREAHSFDHLETES